MTWRRGGSRPPPCGTACSCAQVCDSGPGDSGEPGPLPTGVCQLQLAPRCKLSAAAKPPRIRVSEMKGNLEVPAQTFCRQGFIL